MNTLKAQYIKDIETLSDDQVKEILSQTETHTIGNVNWAEFPYAPSVNFKVAYSDKCLALMFEVCEDHVKAASLESNGPVWEDSCVEFFVKTPDGQKYTNFEMNCVGTLLAARRSSRHDADHFAEEKIGKIRRITSLPHEVIDSKGTGLSWWAIEVIPFEFMGYDQTPDALQANLYKCGDKCDQPHFLSWSPIGLPQPDFHCPEFFGQIVLK